MTGMGAVGSSSGAGHGEQCLDASLAPEHLP